MTAYIDSETIPIGEFLSNADSLRVPTFQRNFAWTEEEVKQLWFDITEAMDNGDNDYFLGPMVIKNSINHSEFIDGQQRIATIYIILSVIRRILSSNGDNDRAVWFNNEYFGKKDIYTLEIQPKFQMNEVNDPFFQKFIVGDGDEDDIRADLKNFLKKDTNYLLLHAIITMLSLLRSRQKSFSGKEFDLQSLLAIERYLRKHVYVLLLTVSDEAEAYVIFETLNDRGRSLTTMDLLKNHIFEKAGSQLDIVKDQWGILRENLVDIDPSERFLYHYWSSLHGRTSKSQLFRIMRKNITTPRSAVTFSRELSQAAKFYSAFVNPGHIYWADYDQRTRDNLDILRLLDAQQSLPILLAAVEKFSENEFSKLTDFLVVMAVRYNLIGELRTGVLANYYVEIPKKIRSGELHKCSKVVRELRLIYPEDSDFKQAFSNKVLKDSQKARYILSEIEKQAVGGSFQLIDDPKKINIEHIFPQNPSQDWKDTINSIGADFLQEYTYRIGNLALVTTTSNRGLGSKSFEKKKEQMYSKETEIKFTYHLKDFSTWLKDDIQKRQSLLADEAVKTWRVDILE
jgi:uncharacterized protein with ParB-like and HNH nuclease domain